MIRPRKLLATVTAAHALNHAFLLAFPPLLVPLMNEFKTDLVGGGAAMTGLYLASGLGALPAGWLADRWGPRRLIHIFLGGASLCLILTSFAPDLKTLSVSILFLGLFCSLYHPSGLSLISKRCVPIGRAFGIHGIGGNLGLAFGPFLVAQLSSMFGWRSALMVLASAGIVLMPLFAWSGDRQERSPEGEIRFRPDIGPNHLSLGLAIACQGLLGFCYRGILTFLPLYFTARHGGLLERMDPISAGGLLTSLSLGIGVAGQYFGGWLSNRTSPERLFSILLLATLPFPFLMAFGEGLPLLACAALFAFFFFAAQPVGNLLIARHSGEAWRSLGFGFSFTASFGFGSFAALAGGWIAEKRSLAALFPAMGSVLALGAVVSLLLVRQTRKGRFPASISSGTPPPLSST